MADHTVQEPVAAPKPNVQMLTDTQLRDAALRPDSSVTRYDTTRVTPWKHMPATEKKQRWARAWGMFDAVAAANPDAPDTAVRAMLVANEELCADMQRDLPTAFRISMARITPPDSVHAEFALAQREWVLINIRVQEQVTSGVLDAATARAKLQGLAMARNMRPIQADEIKGATVVDMDGMLKRAGYDPAELNSKDSLMDRMRREGLRVTDADRLHTAQSVLSKTLPSNAPDGQAEDDARAAATAARRNAGMRPGRAAMHDVLRGLAQGTPAGTAQQ